MKYESSSGWLQLVFHLGTENREEELQRKICTLALPPHYLKGRFALTSDWPVAGLHDDGQPHDGNGQCGVWLWKPPAYQGLVNSNFQALTHLSGFGILHLGGQLLHRDTAHHGDGVEGGVDGVRGLAQDKVRLHGATVKARGASLS